MAIARSEDFTSDVKDFSWLMGQSGPKDLNMGRDIAGISLRISMKIFLQPSESRDDDMAVKLLSTFDLARLTCFGGIVQSVAAIRPLSEAGQILAFP